MAKTQPLKKKPKKKNKHILAKNVETVTNTFGELKMINNLICAVLRNEHPVREHILSQSCALLNHLNE